MQLQNIIQKYFYFCCFALNLSKQIKNEFKNRVSQQKSSPRNRRKSQGYNFKCVESRCKLKCGLWS